MRLLPLLFLTATLHAQWTLQTSNTTADLRGIHSLGDGVAWASGTNGTVLHTTDNGVHWLLCTVPPGAEKLDFRGIQAFDANTAIVMSSGPGDKSRLYKTTDTCKTWVDVFDDPDDKGFFDSLHRVTSKQMYLLGDPVGGKFSMFFTSDAGSTWYIADDPGLDAAKDAGAFAASNSAFTHLGNTLFFGTGGPLAAVYSTHAKCNSAAASQCAIVWQPTETPIAHGAAAAGVFSLAGRTTTSMSGKMSALLVAVGGTYDKPDDASASAAFSSDGGQNWTLSTTPPHGYRSAVAYDRNTGFWITVGPNGTDIATDDGRN